MSGVIPGEPVQRGNREPAEVSSLWITNVRLPPSRGHSREEDGYNGTWIVKCSGGVVIDVSKASDPGHSTPAVDDTQILDAGGGIMLPSLCHSHIHLDKCFILDQCGDLTNGDFKEAMTITLKAKEGFPSRLDDLYERGTRLIKESVENGVTSMRAHVEVDTIVGYSCLDVALELKSQYKDICDVQIAVFAQEALFNNASDSEPGQNYTILCQAMRKEGVSVIGSAPYVEPTTEQAKKNIKLIFEAAMGSQEEPLTAARHIDFHLDYNLDSAAEPLIHEVIAQAKAYYHFSSSECHAGNHQQSRSITSQPCGRNSCSAGPRITIGHATRLQLLSTSEWHELRKAIGELPITIVGLPQSDMYIQGRAHQGDPLGPPRSTLRVPLIEKAYGIKVAMAVNNVDNAFTPQGTLDPLSSLVTFGVAIFQAVTPREIRTLIEAVTLTSKRAIGLWTKHPISLIDLTASEGGGGDRILKAPETQGGTLQAPIPTDLFPTRGDPADFVVLHENSSLRSAALHPSFERTTIKDGKIVARRRKWRWISGGTD